MKKFLEKKLCYKYKEENLFLKKEIEKLQKEIKILKKENKNLKLINESKDDLIYAVSHEFKNPITIMSGFIETIINNNLDKETEEKFLLKIQNNALRLSELIDRLYLMIKIENKKIKLQKSKFDLAFLIKNIIQNFDNNRLIFDDTESSYFIYADKALIEVVIVNLITNALKYSKDIVTIKIEDSKCKVIDKGIGIDEKDIKLITEKFYRSAKNDWDNSLGIGLTIVTKILKLHNSKLEIKSQKSIGSEFSFDLNNLIYDSTSKSK